MDNTTIEGDYYRPNTTALEAQRIGLSVIREAVGEQVLLDKDGSPMLNPVGIVDEGRISRDTGHSFLGWGSKESATGIAARYYMNGNFFRDDPNASLSRGRLRRNEPMRAPLTFSEAQVSLWGGSTGRMFEIGDDLPKLGEDPDRVALAENPDLLQMAKLGRASLPLDSLTYQSTDEQPSIFLLREDKRQAHASVAAPAPRSHVIDLSQLSLPVQHAYSLYDGMNHDRPLTLENFSIQLDDQPAHSVRLIKIIDDSIPAAAPSITTNVPAYSKAEEQIVFSGAAAIDGVPAVTYHWDFGDGIKADGTKLAHTYTQPGTYRVVLTVEGVDGVAWVKSHLIVISGTLKPMPPQRYIELNN